MRNHRPSVIPCLALGVLLPALSPAAPPASHFAAGTHALQMTRIDGGNFVRDADGAQPATVEISGQGGLLVTGGRFSTEQPAELTQGVELARGKSIALYNKSAVAAAQGGAAGRPEHVLYTEAEVRAIFASGNAQRISEAFTSADAHGVAPQPLSEAAVLAALRAAQQLAQARELTGWRLASADGDVHIQGGQFDFHSPNQNVMAAPAGTLLWDGGQLQASGGGGDTVLLGAQGIALTGGRIASLGSQPGGSWAVQYDPRRRLDRDRWTLGKYLALVTDGDITIGQPGQPGGSDLQLTDGMLKISAVSARPPQAAAGGAGPQLRLYGGAIRLEGIHRSTLLAMEAGFGMRALIDGGTLSVRSSPSLVGSPLESPSMWNMSTVLKSGVVSLDNAHLVGAGSAILGGQLHLSGQSAIYGGAGELSISGGRIEVSPQSFIGAIRGDSRARSPYPSSQHNLLLDGGTLHFQVLAPAPGQPLQVGTHIGGIHAGDNQPARQSQPRLRIGPAVRIELDTAALAPGRYTVTDFASVQEGDGVLDIAAPLPLGSADGRYHGVLHTDGRLTLVVR